MRVKVSDYIVEAFVKRGINIFFGYQGGNISHLIDSIGNCLDAQFVGTCHEQAAAFAANSYAQISGNIGVALASSGPGAINLINGIANAFCDSIPCIFFTGDVNTTAKRADGSKRQNAFQEIDILPIVQSITKYSVSIKSPKDICCELEKSFFIAESGRPGPVVINLPHDIQRSYIDVENMEDKHTPVFQKKIDIEKQTKHVVNLINTASRPLFLIGGGLRTKKTRALFNHILNETNIPVICSLLGLDIVKHDHPCYRGVIGDYGLEAANKILRSADCVVVLGSRLDDRQISASLAEELSEIRFIHIDIDPNELRNKIKEEETIECDLLDFLSEFKKQVHEVKCFREWIETTFEIFKNDRQFVENQFHPNSFIRDVSKVCECAYSFDVGNNQMHAMQAVVAHENTRILTSGGLGSMGYSIPAAIGACFVNGINKVIAICGDGGIQMNIQELQTISYYDLPINIMLLNNSGLGMIYDLQNKLFDGRHTGTTDNYGVPDFESVATAYGFKYCRVEKHTDYADAIYRLKNETGIFVEFVFNIGTLVSMK